jgi:hypothetical protein
LAQSLPKWHLAEIPGSEVSYLGVFVCGFFFRTESTSKRKREKAMLQEENVLSTSVLNFFVKILAIAESILGFPKSTARRVQIKAE